MQDSSGEVGLSLDREGILGNMVTPSFVLRWSAWNCGGAEGRGFSMLMSV